MAKKFIKKYIPNHQTIRDNKYLKIFGKTLHDPNLWHLNRRSVSGAFGIGLFSAFVPMPFQMILAAALAIPARVNLPIAIALVWISNPLTIPPMLVGVYLLGAWVMNIPFIDLFAVFDQYDTTMQAVKAVWSQIWKPVLLGCAISGTFFGLLGFFGIRLLWRMHVVKEWEIRKQKRLDQKQQNQKQ